MPLIKNGSIATHDWHLLDQESGAIAPGDIVVDMDQLLAAKKTWRLRPGRLGVALSGDADLSALTGWLDRLSLIVVDFSAFTDGRGFSLARRLRVTMGYTGEIWARGPLIADQYSFALQCGFDAVLLDEAVFARQDVSSWERQAQALSLAYQAGQLAGQGGFGRPKSILALRQAARFSAAAE